MFHFKFIFQNIQSWQRIFLITGALHLFSVMFYSVFGSGEQQEWAQPTYKTLVSDRESTDYGSVEKNNIDVNLTIHNEEQENHEYQGNS